MELILLSFNMRGWPVNHNRILKSIEGLAGMVNSLRNDLDLICVQELPYVKDEYYVNLLEGMLTDFTVNMPLPCYNKRQRVKAWK